MGILRSLKLFDICDSTWISFDLINWARVIKLQGLMQGQNTEFNSPKDF